LNKPSIYLLQKDQHSFKSGAGLHFPALLNS